ncbi:hypothetical protein RRG08_022951 [Elysia crispata]|uniref:Ankyrin repeat protein n=1 Tax=Elysia crispata TaxID=231223 RepID=A0AAE1DYK2_9GAST|nr:hypothetical protein RRG08_022951 [Elysia crispata]
MSDMSAIEEKASEGHGEKGTKKNEASHCFQYFDQYVYPDLPKETKVFKPIRTERLDRAFDTQNEVLTQRSMSYEENLRFHGIFFLLTMDNFELCESISKLDLDEVNRLVASGRCSINGDVSRREPPIIECVRLKRLKEHDKEDARRCEMLQILVRHGADVNVKGKSGSWLYGGPAVSRAAEWGYERCLRFLVQSGADLSMTSKSGDTALMIAVRMRRAFCVDYLVKHMTVSMLNHNNNIGETALMLAACYDLFCVRRISTAGAALDLQDRGGNTALMIALRYGCHDVVKFLLSKNALFTTVTKSGHTPLSSAHNRGIVHLLRYKLDPSLSRRDRYMFHSIVRSWSYDAAVRALVRNGFPPLDLDCKSEVLTKPDVVLSTPISPLAVAILATRIRVVKFLVINRFFTRYDVNRLCWEPDLRQFLLDESKEGKLMCVQARQCLEVLNFLSKRPHSLRTLCLINISSFLSQDLGLDLPDTTRDKDRWTCKPTFKEKVKLLEIPRSLKRELLHKTPLSTICCLSWADITIGEEQRFPECNCGHCTGEQL